jgi:hypothetical protein
MRTLRKLNESARLLGAGRDIQRRADCRILNARIAVLRHKALTENDLTATLMAAELDELVKAITAPTKGEIDDNQ